MRFASIFRKTTNLLNIAGDKRSFHLSCTSSQLLIEDPKYSWLKELGLESDNKGVFDGTWKDGNGTVSCKDGQQ